MRSLAASIILLLALNSCSKREIETEKQNKTSAIPLEFILRNNIIINHKGSQKEITIPENVNGEKIIAIGDGALSKNPSFVKVILPSTIEMIGRGAFAECTSLQTVFISDAVRDIGKAPFAACSSLNSIKVSLQNRNYRELDGVLFDKQLKNLIQYPANASSTYEVPASVTTINEAAFAECLKLESIIFPKTLNKIEKAAFLGCSMLKEVILPESLKVISEGTFVGCSNLKTVTIPESVTVIEDGAFAHCTRLESIVFEGLPPLTGNGVFTNCSPKIYVSKNKGWTDSYLNLKTVKQPG